MSWHKLHTLDSVRVIRWEGRSDGFYPHRFRHTATDLDVRFIQIPGMTGSTSPFITKVLANERCKTKLPYAAADTSVFAHLTSGGRTVPLSAVYSSESGTHNHMR